MNTSAIAGLHPAPGLAAYGASEWGLRSLTRTAAHELAPSTPLAYDPTTGADLVPVDGFAIPRQVSTAEIAGYVLFVASQDASFSTGSEFVADGGFALGQIA